MGICLWNLAHYKHTFSKKEGQQAAKKDNATSHLGVLLCPLNCLVFCSLPPPLPPHIHVFLPSNLVYFRIIPASIAFVNMIQPDMFHFSSTLTFCKVEFIGITSLIVPSYSCGGSSNKDGCCSCSMRFCSSRCSSWILFSGVGKSSGIVPPRRLMASRTSCPTV
jgi:hypothetical protein